MAGPMYHVGAFDLPGIATWWVGGSLVILPRFDVPDVKLVNNFLFAANAQLVAEAVQLGSALGVAPGDLLEALNHMSSGSQAGRQAAEQADLAAFSARIAPFVKKDVAVCLEQAAERGVDPRLLIEVVQRGPLELT